MRTASHVRTIAVSGAALLALTACAAAATTAAATPADSGSEEKQINIYGTDGNMGDAAR